VPWYISPIPPLYTGLLRKRLPARDKGIKMLIKHSNYEAFVVDTAPPRAPRHLDVFTARNPPMLLPVKFAAICKDARARGHVESKGKGLCHTDSQKSASQYIYYIKPL
jgi:hypothetical protein